VIVAVAVLTAACGTTSPAAGGGEQPTDRATSTCTADPPVRPPAAPVTLTTVTVPAPGPTTTAGATPVVWQVGASGPDVVAFEQRLAALGYWLGEANGVVTEDGVHAVVALQKVAGLDRTGTIDGATRVALDRGVVPVPRTTSGLVVEVDITHQVLLLVRDGQLVATLDTSTGRSGLETPVGTYTIYEAVDIVDDGQGEYRPMFFYEPLALAIHGYESVPAVPYSHGCARLTLPAMDVLWANGVGVGTAVVVYA